MIHIFYYIIIGWFVSKWHGKMINIHPSLLPSFKGRDVHQKVIDAGVRVTGCTVHFVTKEMDQGAIIAQNTVSVDGDDTPQSIQEKVKVIEHKTYPQALDDVVGGRIALSKTENKIIITKC